MRINLGTVKAFELRFIAAAALAGASELLLALTPLGTWLGKHLSMFGYLGTGMLLLAFWHYVLLLYQEKK